MWSPGGADYVFFVYLFEREDRKTRRLRQQKLSDHPGGMQ